MKSSWHCVNFVLATMNMTLNKEGGSSTMSDLIKINFVKLVNLVPVHLCLRSSAKLISSDAFSLTVFKS